MSGHRSLWEGVVAFGLVQIPVHLFTAESRERLAFDLVDRRDHARIGHRRINRRTGEVVEWGDVVRGFEVEGGGHVILEKEDFERANQVTTHTVDIVHFADPATIEPILLARPYYVAPTPDGERGYVLLREALRRSGKVGIARVVLRTREHVAALMVRGPALVLHTLRYAHEVVGPDELELPDEREAAIEISATELETAAQLIAEMSRPFRADEHRDTYRDDLLALIEARRREGIEARGREESEEEGREDAGGARADDDDDATEDEVAAPLARPEPTRAVDLLGLLRGSLATRH